VNDWRISTRNPFSSPFSLTDFPFHIVFVKLLTLIDETLKTVYEKAINFDRDLPRFNTSGGVHMAEDGLTVTSPALMWVAALDLLLDQMHADNAPLSAVRAISGSGQQHGSVWLNASAAATLENLQADTSLEAQCANIFSIPDSPVWMDSSTGAQCAAREAALGGAQAVADLTGSRAYERFTGNQIAKIYESQPDAYAATSRIALVSSFIPSLLIGGFAPIDASDGSGMNLMDIRSKQWAQPALACTAPDLAQKLGPIVASHEPIGTLHARFSARYGFASDVKVIAFSGDNPNSLAGLRLQDTGDVAISLGTSDTVFGFLAEAKPSASEGHIFANPVAPDAYMAMLCYKNGSLTRELVRDQSADGSWKTFAQLLEQSAAGNNGNIGFYIRDPEITPPIMTTGIWRFDANDNPVDAFDAATECRAVYETQFLSMRLHGQHVGFEPQRILATGGASVDMSLIRVMCDVFGAPVFVAEKSDSASLGAAYRALHGWRCQENGGFIPFADILKSAAPFKQVATPDATAHATYTSMLERFAALEKTHYRARRLVRSRKKSCKDS
jgi:xylulokinase